LCDGVYTDQAARNKLNVVGRPLVRYDVSASLAPVFDANLAGR